MRIFYSQLLAKHRFHLFFLNKKNPDHVYVTIKYADPNHKYCMEKPYTKQTEAIIQTKKNVLYYLFKNIRIKEQNNYYYLI